MSSAPTAIFFDTERNGRKVAYRWDGRQLRSFRIALDKAEVAIATGTGVDIGGHPLKARSPFWTRRTA